MPSIPSSSKPFWEYFKSINGSEINIDFSSRQITVFDSDNQIVSIVHFSKGIQHSFTIEELMKKEHELGEKAYEVFENGYLNKNWLWSAEVVAKLEL